MKKFRSGFQYSADMKKLAKRTCCLILWWTAAGAGVGCEHVQKQTEPVVGAKSEMSLEKSIESSSNPTEFIKNSIARGNSDELHEFLSIIGENLNFCWRKEIENSFVNRAKLESALVIHIAVPFLKSKDYRQRELAAQE
jgi:hypothetical protein